MARDPAVDAVRAVAESERVACRRCGQLPTVVVCTEPAPGDKGPDWITVRGTCSCPPNTTERTTTP